MKPNIQKVTANYLNVLGSGIGGVDKVGPSFNCLLGCPVLVAMSIAGNTVYS